MAMLHISLFGTMSIAHNGGPTEVKTTYTVQALLAYLVLERQRRHPREVLAGLLWGEYSEERARSCLSTALWRLRAVLEPQGVARGTYLVATPSGEVGFNPESRYWLDVAIFEESARQVLAQRAEALGAGAVAALEAALPLCHAELLESFSCDWALRERERLRAMHLSCLAHLMQYYRHQGSHAQAVAYGEAILQRDPLREEIHRELMRSYVANGQRALALRQYERCRQVLAEELGIPPMEETQLLRRQILAGSAPPIPAALVPGDVPRVLQELQAVVRGLEAARVEVEQAVKTVEQLSAHSPHT